MNNDSALLAYRLKPLGQVCRFGEFLSLLTACQPQLSIRGNIVYYSITPLSHWKPERVRSKCLCTGIRDFVCSSSNKQTGHLLVFVEDHKASESHAGSCHRQSLTPNDSPGFAYYLGLHLRSPGLSTNGFKRHFPSVQAQYLQLHLILRFYTQRMIYTQWP